MAIETVECFIHGIKGVVYSFITKSGLFLLSVCVERFSLKFRVCVRENKMNWERSRHNEESDFWLRGSPVTSILSKQKAKIK